MVSSATQVFFFVMLTNIVEVVLLNVLCKVVQLYYFLFMGAQMFAGVGLVFDVKCAHASTYKYTQKDNTNTPHNTPILIRFGLLTINQKVVSICHPRKSE